MPVERLTEVPVGALGFRIAGHLRREDYTELLLLPVRAAVERGDPVRVLVVINPSFDDLEPAALLQDLKVSGSRTARPGGASRSSRAIAQAASLSASGFAPPTIRTA